MFSIEYGWLGHWLWGVSCTVSWGTSQDPKEHGRSLGAILHCLEVSECKFHLENRGDLPKVLALWSCQVPDSEEKQCFTKLWRRALCRAAQVNTFVAQLSCTYLTGIVIHNCGSRIYPVGKSPECLGEVSTRSSDGGCILPECASPHFAPPLNRAFLETNLSWMWLAYVTEFADYPKFGYQRW